MGSRARCDQREEFRRLCEQIRFRNLQDKDTTSDSLPVIVAAEDVSFVVISPAENGINLPHVSREAEIFEIVSVNFAISVDDDDILAVEEHKLAVASLEDGIDVIE